MKRGSTLLVAATGGHLSQLHHFASRLLPPDEPAHWVTTENAQSRSLLDGRSVTFVPYVGVRDLRGVARCLPVAHRLHSTVTVSRAISTGSGIALGFLPYLAARGIPCHYIESAARVSSPSITGRLLARMPGVRTYTQYAAWAGAGWHVTECVFDSFRQEEAAPGDRGPLKIVVTLGTAGEFPFRRLLETLAPLLRPGGPLETETGRQLDVTWQTGATPTDDLPVRAVPFLPAQELVQALGGADLVIAHCGTGSALDALDAGAMPVLVPRRATHGEAGDDHQLELAAELSRRGLAVVAEADRVGLEHLTRALSSSVVRKRDYEMPLVLLS
jgi:UDP-N-acetylglucosamine--N-acetylmuramyl-(pentapeptide) pyrophosphoryl-undecaprenol N-acetylglucosamine transferase